MIDDPALDHTRRPTVTRPLHGLTVLAVEDSLYACDALRLMCLYSGARLRRADCLRSARRHLQVYRPTVVIVDMGLPDGCGAELIAELSVGMPRISVILGTSADAFAEDVAHAAGADGFLAKPVATLGVFQHAILQHLPDEIKPFGPRVIRSEPVCPDPVTFREDMAHIAGLLEKPMDQARMDYITLFLRGVARTAADVDLDQAVTDLEEARSGGRTLQNAMSQLNIVVQSRLQDVATV